jgi:hypothetical protein
MQRLFERAAREDYGLNSGSCEDAWERQISEEDSDSSGGTDADDPAIKPEMDRRAQAAGFVDEFGNGVAFKHVDGQWLFAGFISR